MSDRTFTSFLNLVMKTHDRSNLASPFQSTTCFWGWLVGSGAVYSFDPVGSYEREACRAAGAAQSLVQPFLDNQVRTISILTAGAITDIGNF